MKSTRLSGLVIALFSAAVLGACASGGSGVLTSTDLTAEQLADAQYETVYDFLRAHNHARIITVRGDEFLKVYSRGGDIRSADIGSGDFDPSNRSPGSGESAAPEVTGTADAPGGGEALLIIDEKEVTGNVTQILQGISMSDVQSLKILRPSQTSARYGGDGRVGSVVIEMKGSGSGSGN